MLDMYYLRYIENDADLETAQSLYDATVVPSDTILELALSEDAQPQFGGMLFPFASQLADCITDEVVPSLRESILQKKVEAALLVNRETGKPGAFAAWSHNARNIEGILRSLNLPTRHVDRFLEFSNTTVVLEEIASAVGTSGTKLFEVLKVHWKHSNMTHAIGYRHRGFYFGKLHQERHYVPAENNSSRKFCEDQKLLILGEHDAPAYCLRENGTVYLQSRQLWVGTVLGSERIRTRKK